MTFISEYITEMRPIRELGFMYDGRKRGEVLIGLKARFYESKEVQDGELKRLELGEGGFGEGEPVAELDLTIDVERAHAALVLVKHVSACVQNDQPVCLYKRCFMA